MLSCFLDMACQNGVWFLMTFLADLHIHSRFSRATSAALNPESLSLWGQKKGISVLGTGDFTHPGWFAELTDRLLPCPEGLHPLKPEFQVQVQAQAPASCLGTTRFLLSGEISCIYKRAGKTRKIHHLILMPDFDAARRFNRRLERIGNLASDGRPILGLDSRDLLEIVLETHEQALLIPAHIWTPWFSLFGSKSGFDAIEECFGDLAGHIHALETGLSSDPAMNRLLTALDGFVLVSNSDAHSPGKLGREANLLHTDMDYPHIWKALQGGDGFLGTIEFFPEEGKYHLDGHRKCQVHLEPKETARFQGICPVCGKPLTIGVLSRVHELADRTHPTPSGGFTSLIPLPEILSELLGAGPSSKKVLNQYERLLQVLGPELQILMNLPTDQMDDPEVPLLALAIERMRQNQVIREGGYDGQFGRIRLFHQGEMERLIGQLALFGHPGPATKPQISFHPTPQMPPVQQEPQAPWEAPSFGESILHSLNPEQQQALLHQEGHFLVVAGPGTGKTRTLTHRIAHEIQMGLSQPGQILALTFTRKAAREMTERIQGLMKDPLGEAPRATTFHAFCLDLLQACGDRTGLPQGFRVCPETDAREIARRILKKAPSDPQGPRSAGSFLKALSRLKAPWAFPQEGPETIQVWRPLCQQYQAFLRKEGLLDLEDLEIEALRLLKEYPDVAAAWGKRFPRIFVDEYQDTNGLQVQILKLLVQGGQSCLFAIGDPDQAIYGFRGAEAGHFRRFSQDFPGAKIISLRKNYRSSRAILNAAASLMGHPVPLDPLSTHPLPVFQTHCSTEGEEAEMIVEQIERILGGTSLFSLDSGRSDGNSQESDLGFGDFGVLYRLNVQGDAIEKALVRAGIPCMRSGETPLTARYPVDLIFRFLQTMLHPASSLYKEAYLERLSARSIPPFPGGPTDLDSSMPLPSLVQEIIRLHRLRMEDEEARRALDRLKDLTDRHQGGLALFLDALALDRGVDHSSLSGDRVALMSLHAAKGLEWSVTFLTGCEDRLLPCDLFGDRDEEEERRLFYVGMTRARSRLILSRVQKRALGGRILAMGPSPFLGDLPKEECRPLERHRGAMKRKGPRQLSLF